MIYQLNLNFSPDQSLGADVGQSARSDSFCWKTFRKDFTYHRNTRIICVIIEYIEIWSSHKRVLTVQAEKSTHWDPSV